jgi:uncharacterized protein (TIGR00251 family)
VAFVTIDKDGLILACHIQPKASRDAIVGIHDDRLKIQVASPPVDGKANEQLIRFIAKVLGVAKSRVTLVRGQSSRHKTLHVAGLDALPENFPYRPENSPCRP